jgi:hypothetical protein
MACLYSGVISAVMILLSLYWFDEDYADLFACEGLGEVEVGAVAFGAGTYGLV